MGHLDKKFKVRLTRDPHNPLIFEGQWAIEEGGVLRVQTDSGGSVSLYAPHAWIDVDQLNKHAERWGATQQTTDT